jgi:hypothetical protein
MLAASVVSIRTAIQRTCGLHVEIIFALLFGGQGVFWDDGRLAMVEHPNAGCISPR